MRGSWLIAGVALAAFFSTPSQAFGLKTHLWIAQTIYDDMADCRLSLREGQAFEVPTEMCTSVLAHRAEFLAGSIGPDAFPDIVTGQSIIHPGDSRTGWVTADWLDHLAAKARHPAEIAFSAGFLLHAAGDIFAHSYVNNYAGDFFVLNDERLVERRHTLLERYIDQHMPVPASGPIDPEDLDAPFGFIANTMIFDEAAKTANRAKPTGRHHWALASLREEVLDYVEEAKRDLRKARAKHDPDGAAGDPQCPRDGDPGEGGFGRALPAAAASDPEVQAATEALAFACEWEWGIQIAAREYLRASLDTSRQIVGGNLGSEPGRHYQYWYSCHGKALLGEPVEIGRARCRINRELGISQDYRDLRLQAVSPLIGRIRARFRAWKKQLGEQAAEALLKNSVDVLRTTRMLLYDMIRPGPITSGNLHEVFGTSEAKPILTFPRAGLDGQARPADRLRVHQLVEADMHLDRGKLDPARFKPLDYALLLGKLALLDRDGLKAVAVAYGGGSAEVRTSPTPQRYSVLMDTARSLDGNHQWMRHALPYPRASGDPVPAAQDEREYGFGPGSSGRWQGFPFFADPVLREKVFARLFPEPFEGAILGRTEFQPPAYPYVSCPGDRMRPPPADGSGIRATECR